MPSKSKTRNKPRICIALFHRDKHSLDKSLGLAIYHWAILIRPKHIKSITSEHFACFDVTDADITRSWRFRVRKPFDVVTDARFLGAVVIGKLSRDVELDVEGILKAVPLPQTTEQNCVTWTQDAIKMLKERGLVDVGVEIEEGMEEGMRLGDEVMRDGRKDRGEGMFRYLI